MAWIKIPAEHHPLFHAALPKDPRVSTLLMFGGLAAKVNGQMFAGLFARSALVKLSADDQARALALDGAGPFDPMGNGRIMRDTVMLPDSIMEEPEELRAWLRRGFDYVLTLPPKAKKSAGRSAAEKRAVEKTAAKKVTAKRPGPKKAAARTKAHRR